MLLPFWNHIWWVRRWSVCYTVGLCRFTVWQHNHEVYPLMVLNEQHVSHRLLYLCTYFPNRGVTPGKKKVYFTSQTWKLRASLVYSLWYQLWGSFLRYVQASDSHYNYNIPVCFNKDGCVHLKLPWVSWKTSRSLINQSTPSSMQRTRKLKAFSSLWLS